MQLFVFGEREREREIGRERKGIEETPEGGEERVRVRVWFTPKKGEGWVCRKISRVAPPPPPQSSSSPFFFSLSSLRVSFAHFHPSKKNFPHSLTHTRNEQNKPKPNTHTQGFAGCMSGSHPDLRSHSHYTYKLAGCNAQMCNNTVRTCQTSSRFA